jgi:hypothetical protein
MALVHGLADGIEQGRVAGKVWETLTQVHRLVLGSQGRHHGEYGGADFWQAAA